MSSPEEQIRVYSNVGNMENTMKFNLNIIPMVIYVSDNLIAKILSLKGVAN